MITKANRELNELEAGVGFKLFEKSVPAFTFSIALLWCAYGVWLFFINPGAISERWTAGELGDFFGGGLGGLAIIGLVYTTWVSSRQFGLHQKQYQAQAQQLEMQRHDMAEAGVLRVYQTLKPELEGISIRIISKLMKAGLIEFRRQDFDKHAEKFRAGDRTVFLRHIQKLGVNTDFIKSDTPSQEIADAQHAVQRFIEMMAVLDGSLSTMERHPSRVHEDFCRGLKGTEIFKCYRSLKQI